MARRSDVMFRRSDYEPKKSNTPRPPEGSVNFEAGMRLVKLDGWVGTLGARVCSA
jgi:hypothetical protein